VSEGLVLVSCDSVACVVACVVAFNLSFNLSLHDNCNPKPVKLTTLPNPPVDSVLHILTLLFISSPFKNDMQLKVLHILLPYFPPNLQALWRSFIFLPRLRQASDRNMEAKKIFFEYKVLDGLRRWRDDSSGTLEEVRAGVKEG
jgi:hypothetical protein